MHIIYRLCEPRDTGKVKPAWATKRACLENFIRVFGPNHQYHFVMDSPSSTTLQMVEEVTEKFFLDDVREVPIDSGESGGRAFILAAEYAVTLSGNLYLVEDDYFHRSNAPGVLEDGLERFHYVTGYDHPDKYQSPGPNPLILNGGEMTRLRLGEFCHWKTTNSTTMTFAVDARALRDDLEAMRCYCLGRAPHDYRMFRDLVALGRTIGSSVPAYSTHCETQWLAPLVNWEELV